MHGFATVGSRDGDAAMVDTRGDPESPGVICKKERRDAAFTSSFEEEKEAVSMTITLASSKAIASGSESVTDIIPLIRQVFSGHYDAVGTRILWSVW